MKCDYQGLNVLTFYVCLAFIPGKYLIEHIIYNTSVLDIINEKIKNKQ